MAATLVTTGISQEVGVRYTYITDAGADWTNVPISTYFYDLETKLPYYKNADSEVLNIFASGGGDSIYTASDSLKSDRTVDLDENDLTFNGDTGGRLLFTADDSGTPDLTPIAFEFGGSWQGYTRWQEGGAVTIKANNNVAPLTVMGKLGTTQLQVNTDGGGFFGTGGNDASWRFSETNAQSGSVEIGESFQKWHRGATAIHGIYTNGTPRGVYLFSAGFSNSVGYCLIGGDTKIESEDISLQGDTLISKQLELSSTTDGFLMNRVTTVQKDAITNLHTNLMVFDTDLGTIERWDGFKWVTQSGAGALGISGAAGDYTYYPDYNTAITAAVSGETIEQFGNIVETAAVTVTINKDITINMNGYSYTLDNAGTNRAFTIDGTSLSDIKILNGTINRINGTGGGLLNTTSVTVTAKPTLSLEGTTLYCDLVGTGTLLHVTNRYTLSGGLFKGPGDLLLDTDSTLTNFTYNGSGTVRAFRTGVNINNGYIYSSGSFAMSVASGAEASNLTIETSGTGISNSGKVVNCNVHSTGNVAISSSTVGNIHGVFNCVGHSDTSYGIQVSRGKCYDSVGRSTGLYGIFADLRNDPQLVNCTGWSSAGIGIYAFSSGTSGKFVSCYAESELDTTSGHAFGMQGGTTKFINCTGKVKNSGAYGINGSSATASIINFSGIGMASLFNGVTNAQIETTDAYGNVLVV